jgi:hypothetical protein
MHVVTDCSKIELEDRDSTDCSFDGLEVGDVPVGLSSAGFENGTFDWFSVDFSTDYFDNMVEETRRVYGAPCATTSETLQNGYGA